jgi:hypothetical protein
MSEPVQYDFVNNPIQKGDWIAKDGGGNGGKGYAMILCRVDDVTDDAIKVRSLNVRYGPIKISLSRLTTIKSVKKVVRVEPSEWAKEMFAKCESDTLTAEDKKHIGKWIHKGIEPNSP